MAEVIAKDFKKVGKPFANQLEVRRFVYDVALDGGAFADTFTLGQFDDDCVVVNAYVNVTTSFVGASSTYTVGIGGSASNVLASTAVGSMNAGIKQGASASVGLLAAKDAKLFVSIGTANATAGKLEVVLMVAAR